ncbi:hypothetical protein [Nocardia yamanashiensis]|uniref:hypothetical protein n=1 Tax=Nocardia yamanashiensis TaxID=209247 RepID=UPI000835AB64|nr:hypothetical protein [Nocardia yamanashiensis]
MDHCWHTTDAVVVSITATKAIAPEVDWAIAATALPSLDTPDMRAWIAGHRDAANPACRIVVTPGCRYRDRPLPLPHREICVPPAEYTAFILISNQPDAADRDALWHSQ